VFPEGWTRPAAPADCDRVKTRWYLLGPTCYHFKFVSLADCEGEIAIVYLYNSGDRVRLIFFFESKYFHRGV